MEDIERLGDPQIKLGTLEIWIHGRERPDAYDYDDGNWLYVTARCRAPGSEVLVSGSFMRSPDIERWHQEVLKMNKILSGTATLACLEPELGVEMTASSLGHISMEVKITPNHLSQEHKFRFEIDQSYLNPLIRQCAAVLAEYPVRGKEGPVRR